MPEFQADLGNEERKLAKHKRACKLGRSAAQADGGSRRRRGRGRGKKAMDEGDMALDVPEAPEVANPEQPVKKRRSRTERLSKSKAATKVPLSEDSEEAAKVCKGFGHASGPVAARAPGDVAR